MYYIRRMSMGKRKCDRQPAMIPDDGFVCLVEGKTIGIDAARSRRHITEMKDGRTRLAAVLVFARTDSCVDYGFVIQPRFTRACGWNRVTCSVCKPDSSAPARTVSPLCRSSCAAATRQLG